MTKINLILHAHLPFVRHTEYPKFLEENWLFESINESYIPLLRMLEKLDSENLPFKLTICFSPTLTFMLSDKELIERFKNYMRERIELGEKEVERTAKEEIGILHMAKRYLEDFKSNLEYYEALNSDILREYKKLAEKGKIDLVATAATHAFLPVYKDYTNVVRAQISLGVDSFKSTFGFNSSGFYLPESGYYPGLEKILAENGIKWVQLPSTSVVTAMDKTKYAGYRPVDLSRGVSGFVNNWALTDLILSERDGYPADFDYRDFYRDIGYSLDLDYVRPYIHEPSVRAFTGFKYYRITGRTDKKEYYDYSRAKEKVLLHSDNFLFNISLKSKRAAESGIENPIITLVLDAELLGHRWYEGIYFLENILRKVSNFDGLVFSTPGSCLEQGEKDEIKINECSACKGGRSDVFLDSSNRWIYPHIFNSIERFGEIVERFPEQGSLKIRFLNQVAKEILLAMSSDWPIIMYDRTSVTYAEKRFKNHIGSFNSVYASMLNNAANTKWLITTERSDCIFPDINYKILLS